MSLPQRFDCNGIDGMIASRNGDFVEWDDYAALAADYVEVNNLHLKCRIDIGNLHKENERLKAEVEWLRKADRLVCWNQATEKWEIRHESPR